MPPPIPALTLRGCDRLPLAEANDLQALTRELNDPGKGILDKYLEPYIRPAVTDLKEHIAAAKGLDGGTGDADKVRGSNDDPAVIAEYEQQQLKRDEDYSGA